MRLLQHHPVIVDMVIMDFQRRDCLETLGIKVSAQCLQSQAQHVVRSLDL
jgi:hypothetical protein